MREKIDMQRLPAVLVVCFLALPIGFQSILDAPTSASLQTSSLNETEVVSEQYQPVIAALRSFEGQDMLNPNQIDEETLWLARAIFSETKRAEEQVLVAWVVRNRVDSRYRGKQTYKSVILDPYQFSAFRKGTAQRSFYSGLNASSDLPGWKTALRIAYDVRHLEEEYRPFSILTRHFYSERSMTTKKSPAWANGRNPVRLDGIAEIDAARFRFFEGVS